MKKLRLDKFLKVSRIIKRRTVAKEACDGKRVSINGKIAKAGSEINEGDIIEITFKEKGIKAKVLKIQEHVRKEEASEMYEILEGEEDTDEED